MHRFGEQATGWNTHREWKSEQEEAAAPLLLEVARAPAASQPSSTHLQHVPAPALPSLEGEPRKTRLDLLDHCVLSA